MKQRPRLKYPTYDYYEKYDEDRVNIELPIKKNKNIQHHVLADVQDGDTLQAIALRFNCTVAALKVANNIHRDNEIFAKGKLKIPINAFSLLTETLPSVHTSGNNSPTKSKDLEISNADKNLPLALDIDLQEKLLVASVNSSDVQISVIKSENISNGEIPGPLNEPNSFQFGSKSDISSEISDSRPLLSNNLTTRNTSVEDVVIRELTKNGVDFGIKWYYLLVFAIILLVVAPIIYVFYIAEHIEMHHHILQAHNST